jgi:hypothetical protein
VDAVVNRHDGSAVDQRRQHVVRGVEKVHVLASQRDRNANLLADRIRPGRLDDDSEVLPGDHDLVAVLWAAEQHVFRFPVDAPQLVDQISDISADAKVVVFPDVDGDSHG